MLSGSTCELQNGKMSYIVIDLQSAKKHLETFIEFEAHNIMNCINEENICYRIKILFYNVDFPRLYNLYLCKK